MNLVFRANLVEPNPEQLPIFMHVEFTYIIAFLVKPAVKIRLVFLEGFPPFTISHASLLHRH